MYSVAHGKTADGDTVPLLVDEDGKLVLAGVTVEPAEGTATSALQEALALQLGAGLPAALTAGGGVKVGMTDAIPAGTNTIGAVTGPAAAALATQATLSALNDKIPATQALGGTLTTPTAPVIGVVTCGYSSALSRPIVTPVDSTGVGSVIARKHPPTSRSGSTSLQIQRTLAAFSCSPTVVRAYADTAGWVALFNSASAVADGATPYGGHVRRIEAGGYVEFLFEFRETFTSGLVVAHLTQVTDGAGALATVLSTTARCMFTGQFD